MLLGSSATARADEVVAAVPSPIVGLFVNASDPALGASATNVVRSAFREAGVERVLIRDTPTLTCLAGWKPGSSEPDPSTRLDYEVVVTVSSRERGETGTGLRARPLTPAASALELFVPCPALADSRCEDRLRGEVALLARRMLELSQRRQDEGGAPIVDVIVEATGDHTGMVVGRFGFLRN
jgi:hypothetical protein